MIADAILRQLPFERRVDYWTSRNIEAGIAFDELLGRLPGVFPTSVLGAIRRLARSGSISAEELRRFEFEACRSRSRLIVDQSLPPPHPLNFEWRFTESTALNVLAAAAVSVPPGGSILLFGTPGVARVAIKEKLPYTITFFGEDNAVCDLIDHENRVAGMPIRTARCGSLLVEGQADSVVIDPPWYDDFVKVMLRAATFACRTGGTIHFSMAPSGTGRRTFEHRDQVFDFAAAYGLAAEAISEGRLEYATPFFEANALHAAGLVAPAIWRRADLLRFRKISSCLTPPNTDSLNRGIWQEASLGRTRFFVSSESPTDTQGHLLSSLVEGDILPTVSRNDARRCAANVWTSGNRIFRTVFPNLVLDALHLGPYAARQITSENEWELNAQSRQLLYLNGVLSDIAQLEGVEELSAISGERLCRSNLTDIGFETGSSIIRIGSAT